MPLYFYLLVKFFILISQNNLLKKFLLILFFMHYFKIRAMEGEPQKQVHGQFSPYRIENLFLLNGIASLLGWNAVLTSLDYFAYIYQDYNVYLYFPIPCFIAYAVTGATYHYVSTKFQCQNLLTIGLAGTNVALLLMFVVSLVTPHQDGGFYICLVLTFFVGFFTNIAQLTFMSVMNFFGEQTVSRYTIGTAVGGLWITLLRVILVTILGTDESQILPIVLYMAIAILFNSIVRVLNYSLLKSKVYNEQIIPYFKQLVEVNEGKSFWLQSKEFLIQLQSISKHIHPYPIIIFLNLLITFTLFPNLSLLKQTSLQAIWSTLLFLIFYNLGDFLGKILGDFRWSFNSQGILFLFLCRLYFYYTIPMMDLKFTQSDYLLNNNVFPFINMLLFGFTNGFATNGSFILLFERILKKNPQEIVTRKGNYKKRQDEYNNELGEQMKSYGIIKNSFQSCLQKHLIDSEKSQFCRRSGFSCAVPFRQQMKYGGVLGGICLEMGIVAGSLLAIPLQSWVATGR